MPQSLFKQQPAYQVMPFALEEGFPRFQNEEEQEAFRRHCKFELRKNRVLKKQSQREGWLNRCEDFIKTSPNFSSLADKLGAVTQPARMGLAGACLSLPSTNLLETKLIGKRVLDLCSGSDLPDATYYHEHSLERFAPWFSRLCHHLGADVTAIDIRPQANYEKFKWLVADTFNLPEFAKRLLKHSDFDLICANGLHDPYGYDPAFKAESLTYEHELHLLLRTKLNGPGSVLVFNREKTIIGKV
jgi:hypothetical protein